MNHKSKPISVRISFELIDEIENRAKLEQVSRSEIAEKAFKQYLSDDGIQEMCFLYDVDRENLLKNIRWLLDSGKLFVKDGRLRWNPMARNPEYFSLDDIIDQMNVSDSERERLKRTIANNLNQVTGNDEFGNGAGV